MEMRTALRNLALKLSRYPYILGRVEVGLGERDG